MKIKPLFFLAVIVALVGLEHNLPAADAPKAPTLTDVQKLDIKEKQIQLDETVLQRVNLKAQYEKQDQDLQQQQATVTKELTGLLNKAQDAIDKDKKTWVLNPRTLETEKAPPAEPKK